MILAIAQCDSDKKLFETLEVRNDSFEVYERYSAGYSGEKEFQHRYDGEINPHNFFILEKSYHLGFRLEFIV